MGIIDIERLWCDDITFCPYKCDWMSCPRNLRNIRYRDIPHSYSVDLPQDCPKKESGYIWRKYNDGWFTYFINKKTGEKKYELDEGDIPE